MASTRLGDLGCTAEQKYCNPVMVRPVFSAPKQSGGPGKNSLENCVAKHAPKTMGVHRRFQRNTCFALLSVFPSELPPPPVLPIILDQEKLVHLVCSVVLTSGPDEALMCRCARVMADWSSESKFAKELGIKETAGRSFSVLMRSVSPKTKACFKCQTCSYRGRGVCTHTRRHAARIQR